MSEYFHRYCHDYVVIPDGLACEKKDWFDFRDKSKPIVFQDMTVQSGMNKEEYKQHLEEEFR